MQNATSLVDAIQSKIEKLIHLHRQLEDVNSKLLAENRQLALKSASAEQELKLLKENYQILKITKTLAGEPGLISGEAGVKINELVKEIDKCIALLNK